MFKLGRHKSDRIGERVDFRLSSFQASQVPKGWERLVLSIVSIDTGKTIGKANKAIARSGTCQWTETFSESIWIPHDNASKEIEDCVLKIVVSMGSQRAGILGEVILKLTDYMSSRDSGSLSLPLKKCNYGTIIQVRIQCLNPTTRFSIERDSKESPHTNSNDVDSKSDGSDNMFNKSLGSSPNIHLGATYPDEPVNQDTNFSASGSHRSSDSGDSSISRSNFSPNININGGSYMGRQDSAGSHVSASSSVGPADDFSRSNPSSFNSRVSGSSTPNRWQDSMTQTSSHVPTPLSLQPSVSSKDLLEAAEETIEELRDEAKMWERHAQKLKLDVEKFRKESSDKSKRQGELDMELSAAYSERDSLKQEIEQLKSSLEELTRKQSATNAVKSEAMFSVQKELEDELRFLKESNDNLNIQLKRTQEANIELVSILQELEETTEKQRVDGKDSELLLQIEVLKGKVQELERDCAELTEENLELIFKLKESGKDIREEKDSETSESEIGKDIREEKDSETSESEIGLLKSQIYQLEEQLRSKEFLNGGLNDSSAVQMKDLQKKCADLELELQYFKDHDCANQFEVEGKTSEFAQLQPRGKRETEVKKVLNGKNARNKSQIEELKVSFSLKEKEVDALRHAKNELEGLVTNTQREKTQLDKMLERKSIELESSKHQLEIQISELEDENVQLSERISGLEAQLRYLTNEKESNRLELEDSRSLVADLKDEIANLKVEIDATKGELKLKQLDAQKRLSNIQLETEYLKRSHSKLQSTIVSLIEENSLLQKSNGDLRRQKVELYENSARMEAELSESRKKTFEFKKRVEFLEGKLSSIQNEIVSKVNSLISQLESIFQEHEDQEEKISQIKLVLNQIDVEKAVEMENLKKEIAHLSSQLCATDEERERMQSGAVIEVSGLRTEKIKLENSLHEAHAKVKLYETDLQSLKLESGKKIQGLVDLLNASKQSEEMLMSDIEHMQRQGEAAKSSEEKFKAVASELELKLKASDYEKQQIMEEASSLRVELQKIALLQDEVLVLKSSLEDAKFERGKCEELLQSVSEECEGLKRERVEFMEKILNMQKAFQDGENDRRSRIALEEKLLRLEGDLSAKEASCTREAELKNEINRIKRANSEYQRKIHSLEEEMHELMRKAQVLENDNIVQDGSKLHDLDAVVEDLKAKIHLLENELAESVETNNTYKIQLQQLMADKKSSNTDILKKNESENDTKLQQASKIATLEAELKDMKERYLHMSLQYAQVEAQREELVMKLKSATKKGWFS